MPGPNTDPTAITGDEVATWFKVAIKRGKLPDAPTCNVIADMLNNWRPGGWRHSQTIEGQRPYESAAERDRWDKAARTLQSLIAKRRTTVKASDPARPAMINAMEKVEGVLAAAGIWFGWGPKGKPGPPWHDAARTILRYAQSSLSYGKTSPVAVLSRNSPTVAFTKLALSRLGFPEATEAAISELFRKRANRKAQDGSAVEPEPE